MKNKLKKVKDLEKKIKDDQVNLSAKEIAHHKKLIKSRQNLLKKVNKNDLEIWKNNDLNDFFDKKHSSLQDIIAKKVRLNKFLFVNRNIWVSVFVFAGLASIAASSYFVWKQFFQSSFLDSFNSNYETTKRIILHIGKRPGESKEPDAGTYLSSVQQRIDALFSDKVIDNKRWSSKNLNLKAISKTEIAVDGPSSLIDELLKHKELWITVDQNIEITDLLGDMPYIGVTEEAKTQVWLRNIVRWLYVWYSNTNSDHPTWKVNYSQDIENDIITEIKDKYSASTGPYLGQPVNSDMLNDAYNLEMDNHKGKYTLGFQVSDANKWKAWTMYVYDVMRVIFYNATYNTNGEAGDNRVFIEQNSDDKKQDNNRYLHMFMFVWYGGVSKNIPHTASNEQNTLMKDPTTISPVESKKIYASFFDRYENTPGVQNYGIWGDAVQTNFIRSSDIILGKDRMAPDEFGRVIRQGDDPLLRDDDKPINKDYCLMTKEDNDKEWLRNTLIGIYAIDFDGNFKNGVNASSLDFKNGDSSGSANIKYNNYTYFFASGPESKWNDKDNSKDATNHLANYLRNGLGQYYTKIVEIIDINPLLFSYFILIYLLVGILLVFLCFLIYLIFKYRLIGFIAVLASIAFLYSILATFVIFQTNFVPSMVVIILIGLALYMINLTLFLKYFTSPFNVPEDKTFFEAYLVRSRKIFIKMLWINLPIFLTLYLVFNLVLTVLQGSNILWICYIFSFLLIIFFYLLMLPAFIFQLSKKYRSDPKKLGITVETYNIEQFEKLHFYNIKVEEDKIEDDDAPKSIYFYDKDEEDDVLEKETKKINKSILDKDKNK